MDTSKVTFIIFTVLKRYDQKSLVLVMIYYTLLVSFLYNTIFYHQQNNQVVSVYFNSILFEYIMEYTLRFLKIMVIFEW